MSTRKKWRIRAIPSFTYTQFPSQRKAYAEIVYLRELYAKHLTNLHEVRVEIDEGEGWRSFETITFPEREKER